VLREHRRRGFEDGTGGEPGCVSARSGPNIIPIYEVGEAEGQHFFSMKLVEGGNLSTWIKTNLTAEGMKERGQKRKMNSLRVSASSAFSSKSPEASTMPTSVGYCTET
jgi:serine/threonine protein kinase